MINALVRWGLKNNFRGFGFIVRKFYKNGRIKFKNKYNALMYLNPSEKIDSSIIRFGYFDFDVIECLESELKPGDVFWDIGANTGLHSLSIKWIIPEVTCYAFEPFYKAFSLLQENLKLNKCEINSFNIAFNNDFTINQFHSLDGNLGATSFYPLQNGIDHPFSVVSVPPKFLVENLKLEVPNVIKIDTEGNELNILKGFGNILNSSQLRSIVFEANRDLDLIENYLKKFGFEITRLSSAPNFLAKRN